MKKWLDIVKTILMIGPLIPIFVTSVIKSCDKVRNWRKKNGTNDNGSNSRIISKDDK